MFGTVFICAGALGEHRRGLVHHHWQRGGDTGALTRTGACPAAQTSVTQPVYTLLLQYQCLTL